MASELITHVSDASFQADVLDAKTPVLVDFWAEWCGPCKMIAPILDEVSGSYNGKLKITKVNVDDNREIPAKFGIRGIPTLDAVQGRSARRHQGRRHEQGPADRLHRPATGLTGPHRSPPPRVQGPGQVQRPDFSCHNPPVSWPPTPSPSRQRQSAIRTPAHPPPVLDTTPFRSDFHAP